MTEIVDFWVHRWDIPAIVDHILSHRSQLFAEVLDCNCCLVTLHWIHPLETHISYLILGEWGVLNVLWFFFDQFEHQVLFVLTETFPKFGFIEFRVFSFIFQLAPWDASDDHFQVCVWLECILFLKSRLSEWLTVFFWTSLGFLHSLSELFERHWRCSYGWITLIPAQILETWAWGIMMTITVSMMTATARGFQRKNKASGVKN